MARTCSVEGCGRKHKAKGLCDLHYRQRRYEANPEREKETARRWREANPERKKETNRLWNEANPEYAREWYEANPERAKETNRRWQEANPERKKETNRRWGEANSERKKENNARRRARKRGQQGVVTRGYRARLMAAQKGRCGFCAKPFGPDRKPHVDHMTPLAQGGLHEDSNLQLLCAPCNMSKGAKTHVAFAKTRGKLL